MRLCFTDDYPVPPTRLIAILTHRSFLTDFLAALPVSTESLMIEPGAVPMVSSRLLVSTAGAPPSLTRLFGEQVQLDYTGAWSADDAEGGGGEAQVAVGTGDVRIDVRLPMALDCTDRGSALRVYSELTVTPDRLRRQLSPIVHRTIASAFGVQGLMLRRWIGDVAPEAL